MLYDETTRELVPRVIRRRDEDEDKKAVNGAKNGHGEGESTLLDDEPSGVEPIHASRTIINHVVQTGEGVLSSNAMADKRFSSGKSVHDLGIRSAICVPIKARRLEARLTGKTSDSAEPNGVEQGETLGIIYIDSSVHNFTYGIEQLRLLTHIGGLAGLAIQNAKLIRQSLQAERMAAIGETTAALSHSIKNILQALRGGANVVEMGIKREDLNQLKKGWEVVDRNLGRIYNLTLNLLAFSKPRMPQRTLVQPRVLIEECLELLAPLATSRGVMAVADVAPDQPAVPLDPDGLHQVLMNLLTNALEGIEEDEGGLIRVICKYDDKKRRTVIQVIDNGKGIHPNVMPHLFELFHSTKGNRGTGLGLPVARKIVEEHDGELEVRSKPGEGTTFTITLPAFSEQVKDPQHTHYGAG
jgi:signal transduction histidine kinase